MGRSRLESRLVHCTLPKELVNEPVLNGLVRATGAVVNIRRANIDVEAGVAWFLLELTGEPDDVQAALGWLADRNVQVEEIQDRRA